MGENQVTLFQADFNRAIRVEVSETPLTEDTGALVLREVADRLGLDQLAEGLVDHRSAARVVHPLRELLLTRLFLMAQGWADQDDADLLRHDPALRMAVSGRSGDRALRSAARALEPDGLASQPTQSRLTAMLGSAQNRRTLARGLLDIARERMRASQPRRTRIVLDVDSFAHETHGFQDGVAYNGHYRVEGYHPLVAITDTGDIVGVMLRPGNVHTAKEVRAFLSPMVEALQQDCDELIVRIDAGFADGKLFAWLRQRGVLFLTRLRNNPVLQETVSDWEQATLAAWAAQPTPNGEARHATREFWHRAPSWTYVERVVAVVVERDSHKGELLHHTFYLATNLARSRATSEVILSTYRQRGTAETHIGELVRVLAPRLSCAQRHRQGAPHRKREVGRAENEVTLLLAALAYELAHAVRCLLETATDEGISLDRVRQRVLKVATSVVRHARAVTFRIAATKAHLWQVLARVLPNFLQTTEVAA